MLKNEDENKGPIMGAHAALDAVAKALVEILRDEDMALVDPVEWSITTDLAIKMATLFPGWRVSPEWERREAEEKKIAWNDEAGIQHLKKIRPDIVVHRINRQDNLIVVEAKRLTNKRNYDDDIRKLTLMTKAESVDPNYHYGYTVGLHLVVDLPNGALHSAVAYTGGKADDELTAYFLHKANQLG